jgi:hypothetical protein
VHDPVRLAAAYRDVFEDAEGDVPEADTAGTEGAQHGIDG